MGWQEAQPETAYGKDTGQPPLLTAAIGHVNRVMKTTCPRARDVLACKTYILEEVKAIQIEEKAFTILHWRTHTKRMQIIVIFLMCVCVCVFVRVCACVFPRTLN